MANAKPSLLAGNKRVRGYRKTAAPRTPTKPCPVQNQRRPIQKSSTLDVLHDTEHSALQSPRQVHKIPLVLRMEGVVEHVREGAALPCRDAPECAHERRSPRTEERRRNSEGLVSGVDLLRGRVTRYH